jgi:hypothetical protein
MSRNAIQTRVITAIDVTLEGVFERLLEDDGPLPVMGIQLVQPPRKTKLGSSMD